jgi:hypothetical protein
MLLFDELARKLPLGVADPSHQWARPSCSQRLPACRERHAEDQSAVDASLISRLGSGRTAWSGFHCRDLATSQPRGPGRRLRPGTFGYQFWCREVQGSGCHELNPCNLTARNRVLDNPVSGASRRANLWPSSPRATTTLHVLPSSHFVRAWSPDARRRMQLIRSGFRALRFCAKRVG